MVCCRLMETKHTFGPRPTSSLPSVWGRLLCFILKIPKHPGVSLLLLLLLDRSSRLRSSAAFKGKGLVSPT